MKNSSKKILTELINDLKISKEMIAAKFGKSVRTIERWQKGDFAPSFAERKFLERIYNGYKNKLQK